MTCGDFFMYSTLGRGPLNVGSVLIIGIPKTDSHIDLNTAVSEVDSGIERRVARGLIRSKSGRFLDGVHRHDREGNDDLFLGVALRQRLDEFILDLEVVEILFGA